ncbi:MAG TPA: hypothetical protein VMC04_05815 [Verrucomicrobiae bacterium]|jgi:hypothetical protein|nr:hypothetical protein [Verrucomicrobiae bacterium]
MAAPRFDDAQVAAAFRAHLTTSPRSGSAIRFDEHDPIPVGALRHCTARASICHRARGGKA